MAATRAIVTALLMVSCGMLYMCVYLCSITGGTRSHTGAAGRRPGGRTCAS